jgi:hypothetical protein
MKVSDLDQWLLAKVCTQQHKRSSFIYLFLEVNSILFLEPISSYQHMTASQFRPVDSSHKTQTYSSPQLGVSVYLPPVDSNTTWIVLRLLTRNDNRVFIFHRSQLYRDKYIRFSSDTIYLSSFIYRYRYVSAQIKNKNVPLFVYKLSEIYPVPLPLTCKFISPRTIQPLCLLWRRAWIRKTSRSRTYLIRSLIIFLPSPPRLNWESTMLSTIKNRRYSPRNIDSQEIVFI